MNNNTIQHPISNKYHIHIYFSEDSINEIQTLQKAIKACLNDKIIFDEIHNSPVGPHPMPQVLYLLYKDNFTEVIEWLNKNTNGFNILIHPNTGDALWDHTEGYIWIGQPQTLKTEIFKNE